MMDILIELKSEKARRQVLTIKQDGEEMNLFSDPAIDYVNHIQVKLCSKERPILDRVYFDHCLSFPFLRMSQ